MNFATYLLNASGTQSSGAWISWVMIGGMLVLMYFLIIRPQKKRQKEEQQLRDSLQVGDEIVTIGGVCGKIVSIKEDSILIETGADKNKIRMMKWAIQTNLSAPPPTKAPKKSKKEEKEAKETKKSEDADK